MRLNRLVPGLIAVLFLAVSAAWAAKLVLKDGTTLEGTVIKTSDGYWVKLSDGTSKTVSADDVASFQPDSTAGGGPGAAPASGASAAFRAAGYRATQVESALAAVSIWQEFVDKFPDSPDLAAAQKELDKWKALATEGAEKINGNWVSGDDRKKIIDQAGELTRQAVEMIDNHQTLQAVDKLQQSLKIYPNSFLTNFALGNVAMFKEDYDQALQYYSMATRLRPQSVAAANNLAVADFFHHQWDAAIQEFLTAAKIEDNKDVVQNLITALDLAPPSIRNLPRMKDSVQAANLLASQYSITSPSKDFYLMPPPRPGTGPRPDTGTGRGSLAWSGTGFFITDDGLILTNSHVAKNSKTRLVQMANGKQVSADIVAIDEQYDLALIRIVRSGTNPDKIPFIHLAAADSPNEGADCMVMGFPMIDELGGDIKITRGIVSSAVQDHGKGADVLTDAKVNPGNSGGPILDKYGNVMAIVCMKSITSGEFDSYGIGISAGHIREFLKRNKIDVTPAAPGGNPLSAEDIVTKVKPAIVCILCTN